MSLLNFYEQPLLDASASTEQNAILQTVRLLHGSPDVMDYEGFVNAVLDRQRINPPILGNGIAMPHARTPLVREIVCAAARFAEPVPFGEEGKPVRLIFLFGIPPDRISQYLAMTAALVRRFKNPETLDGLLTATNIDDFLHCLA